MSWIIDTQHSEIGFSVRHMMIARVRGQFESFEGTITINPDNITASSVRGCFESQYGQDWFSLNGCLA
jgi:polyisoprenoid-binding protein YceI